MNYVSRTLTGSAMIILGIILLGFPLFIGISGMFSWIYGIPVLILGIFILLNKKEDHVEPIKSRTKFRGGKK